MLAWLSVWSEVQACIWPSGCHCHSLSLASVKSRLFYLSGTGSPGYSPGQKAVKRVCVRVCVCACVRACVRVCVCVSYVEVAVVLGNSRLPGVVVRLQRGEVLVVAQLQLLTQPRVQRSVSLLPLSPFPHHRRTAPDTHTLQVDKEVRRKAASTPHWSPSRRVSQL